MELWTPVTQAPSSPHAFAEWIRFDAGPVRVQCWPSQDVAVELDNSNQSKDHQEAHRGQPSFPVCRVIYLQ
ncbi:unnamed protein product [Bubo scandiacus]